MEIESQVPLETSEDLSPTEEKTPEVLDLDTVEKFKWAGQEMTPKELQRQVLMQADYTRKTQALAEERKYYDNLQEDLNYVRQNPNAANEFRKVYPEKFHAFLDYIGAKQPEAKSAVTPEIQELMSFKQEFEKERETAYLAQIEAAEAKYTQKYQLADVDKVLQMAMEWRKENPGSRDIPDNIWEKLYKSSHSMVEKKYKEYQSNLVNKQKQANAVGKDTPQGGGIPAQGPANFKTIKEASEAFRHQYNL